MTSLPRIHRPMDPARRWRIVEAIALVLSWAGILLVLACFAWLLYRLS